MHGALPLGRVDALSPVARAKNDGEGENETCENGARTHDENICATPSVELICQGVIRAIFCGAL
jgi:hypothetical protein